MTDQDAIIASLREQLATAQRELAEIRSIKPEPHTDTLPDKWLIFALRVLSLAGHEAAQDGLEGEFATLTRERDDMQHTLERHGFRRCDIAACNCGSWHQMGGLVARWEELADVLAAAGHPLTNANGHLLRKALKALVAERDLLAKECGAARKMMDENQDAVVVLVPPQGQPDHPVSVAVRKHAHDLCAWLEARELVDAAGVKVEV